MAEECSDNPWLHSIVEQYERPLCQYAYSLLRNADLAKEVVQDTFLKLCKQGRRKVEDRIPAWLYRVCRNRALDVIRKEHRVTNLSDEHAAVLAAPGHAPDQTAAARDTARHALAMLAQLPDNQREVIRLKFQQHMSYREISAVTQLSESNVGYLIHMGMKDLRRQMAAL